MMQDILARQRDRAIAAILGYKDDFCDLYLPRDTSKEFRKLVLDQINELYDVALSVGGGVVNQLYLDKIDEIYDFISGED